MQSLQFTHRQRNGERKMTTKPAYWNPKHFARGQRVKYGEFDAVIERHYHEGMWEVRLPGGSACVSGANLIPA